MKYLFLIPARKGSLRLKNKNMREFIGSKSLFDITYEFAESSKMHVAGVVDILVSTDAPSILDRLNKIGYAYSDYERPCSLSSAYTTSDATIVHAVDWYRSRGHYFDWLVLLQVTSPLRTLPGFQRFLKGLTNKSITYSSVSPLPMKRQEVVIMEEMQEESFDNIASASELVHFEDGAYYAASANFIEKNHSIGAQTGAKYLLAEDQWQIDVDTFEDFECAKTLYKMRFFHS
jgi:CMP-N,N'-diacetyllegionaminic acid synthase